MRTIDTLLGKYSQLEKPDMEVRRACVTAVNNLSAVFITEKEVRVSGRTVFIDCPAALKAEINFNHDSIVDSINKAAAPAIVERVV